MGIFHRDFDRTPLAMLNRFLPGLGKVWGWLFSLLRAMGFCATPSNLWIIENAKELVKDRCEEHDYKDVLQLLFDATRSDKVP